MIPLSASCAVTEAAIETACRVASELSSGEYRRGFGEHPRTRHGSGRAAPGCGELSSS